MKILLVCYALVLALASGVASASPQQLEAALEALRQHGFESPRTAIDKLKTAAGSELATLPMPLRMRYHDAMAQLHIAAEDKAGTESHLDALERMQKVEKCVPCGHHRTVRQVQHAIRTQNLNTARKLIRQLDNVVSPDKDLMQAIHYQRAMVHDINGSHSLAIQDAMTTSKLAMENNHPADQVRSLNMLLLANVGRRDLDRAGQFAKEAYALAERIGFTYMLTYVRGNESWIFGLKGDKPNQLRALNEVLAITRRYKGMEDAELLALVNLADYHVMAFEYERGAALAREAIALADKMSKNTAKGVVMGSLGVAQIGLGSTEAGLETLEDGLALLEKAGAKAYAISLQMVLAEQYGKAGRFEPGFKTLQRYVKESEAATAKRQEQAIADAQEKFSGERKDSEIMRLSLENARRSAEVEARTWQQRLWATAALALGLGALLLIQRVSRAGKRNRVLEDDNAILNDQSAHDPLTGAYNRRHCVKVMCEHESLLGAKPRDPASKSSVGLLLLDVDHFKHVNDTFGHGAGDIVLIEIARRLQQLVRQHDVVVRWGGEEFVLVLPGTSSEGMKVLAERVLSLIGEKPFHIGQRSIPVTVSAGCVCYPLLPGQGWEDCLKVADLAMYIAKQEGRNRVVNVGEVDLTVQASLLTTDLRAAAEAGKVQLQTIFGPASGANVIKFR